MFIFFPTMTSVKNSFCVFLARVKTYTHTKNYTCTFTGSHLRAVTDDDDDDDNDADNTGCHSTITRLIDISPIRGRLYSSCVWSGMLHGSETWPVQKQNEVALLRAEMRMVRWMCSIKLKDRIPSGELRERLWLDYVILVLRQNRLW